jgi:hypothetical protein
MALELSRISRSLFHKTVENRFFVEYTNPGTIFSRGGLRAEGLGLRAES